MITEIIKINENAYLKSYIWDYSEELQIRKRPAVIVLPGGAYLCCSDREAEPVAISYLAEGFNTFVLFYTTRKGFEEPFAEAKIALEILRAKADHFYIDPDKITVCGCSAGAHLAAALGTISEVKPAAMVLLYPPVLTSKMMAWEWVKDCKGIIDLVDKVNKDTVPTFIACSRQDASVPVFNTVAFLDKLEKHGIPFESHIFGYGPHGFSTGKKISSSAMPQMENSNLAKWFGLSVEWIKTTVGDLEFF